MVIGVLHLAILFVALSISIWGHLALSLLGISRSEFTILTQRMIAISRTGTYFSAGTHNE